ARSRRRTRRLRRDGGRRVRQRADGARRPRAGLRALIACAIRGIEKGGERRAVLPARHVERVGADSLDELYSPVQSPFGDQEKETVTARDRATRRKTHADTGRVRVPEEDSRAQQAVLPIQPLADLDL